MFRANTTQQPDTSDISIMPLKSTFPPSRLACTVIAAVLAFTSNTLHAASSDGLQVKTKQGKVEGTQNGLCSGLPWHSLRCSADWAAALEGSRTCGEVERRSRGQELRRALHAADDLQRHDLPRSGRKRGLPDAERLDAREGEVGQTSRDGLDLRWRLSGGRNVGAAAGWRESGGEARCDRRVDELSFGHLRLLRQCGVGAGIAIMDRRETTV